MTPSLLYVVKFYLISTVWSQNFLLQLLQIISFRQDFSKLSVVPLGFPKKVVKFGMEGKTLQKLLCSHYKKRYQSTYFHFEKPMPNLNFFAFAILSTNPSEETSIQFQTPNSYLLLFELLEICLWECESFLNTSNSNLLVKIHYAKFQTET